MASIASNVQPSDVSGSHIPGSGSVPVSSQQTSSSQAPRNSSVPHPQQQQQHCLYGNDPSQGFIKTEYQEHDDTPTSAMSSGGGGNNEHASSSNLAQQHSGSSGSNVPIAGGGVGHQASSLNPVAGSASHGIGAGGISHHSASGSNHSSSLLWAKTQQLPEELFRQLQSIYGDHFPLEARHHLAGWIEASFAGVEELEVGGGSNPAHEEHARVLVISLVQQLEQKAAETSDFLTKNKLEQIIENFKHRYSNNPTSLYTIVRHCLHAEMDLVQKAEMEMQTQNTSNFSGSAPNPFSVGMGAGVVNYQISQQLSALKKSTQHCQISIERLRQDQEHHSINFYKHHQISVQLDGGQFQEQSQEYVRWKEWRDKVAIELRQSFTNLKLQTSNLANEHLDRIKSLKDLQFRILDQELNTWKREQQLAGNGAPFSNNLDTIQKWCEDLAEIIWANRQQIRQLEMIQEGLNIPPQELTMNILPELSEGLDMLLTQLVKSSFVIEKQPPQVLKTNTRFSATVRLLVGTKLHVHMSPPIVTVSIISEAQANSLLRSGPKSRAEYSSGEILNNKQTMEYHQATGQLSVSFRNMSLKKIKRAEKKGTESVMDEKFALLFWSEFPVGNAAENCYQVCAPSLPVVVIVHGNQEPHAWATILWDNAFAEWGRQPFLVPDKVPWIQVAATLDVKFKASCGRGLTEDNLRFLASKVYRQHGSSSSYPDYSGLMISWSQFCKEPLPDRQHTFWDWFHAVMKLTKEDLRPQWIDRALHGFLTRQQTEEYLNKSPNGTFLIRFSDSEPGGVTIAWITVNETGQREVAMLQPFTRKDLVIRSLPDRLNDCPQMLYLYPDIPKDVAFGKYYSQQTHEHPSPKTAQGYVPHHLVNVIQGNKDMHSSSSACASPSLSIATAYDQFNSQIKFEEDWKDWKDGASIASVTSPAGSSFSNGINANNFSTGSTSVTFTPPPLPMSNNQNAFTNGVNSTAQTNMVPTSGSYSNSSLSSSGGNMFQGSESSTSMMQNSTYFESNNTSFSSDSHNSFNTECHCRPNYTCSKCFQKEMDI